MNRIILVINKLTNSFFRRGLKLVVLAALITGAQSALASKHSLVVAIDGLRGDGIENADTPNMDKLINGTWADGYKGAFAHYAQTMTDAAPNSGPNHVGIMTGVTATKSGVTNNSNVAGGNYSQYPHYLTLIENHNSHLNTAYLVTWGTDMQITNSADLRVDSDDAGNTQRAVKIMKGTYADANWTYGARPDAVFLFLDDVDGAGHACCFAANDSGYTNEITEVDGQIGQILDAIKARTNFANEEWQIVITSDHGGRGSSHGVHAADNYTIPFLVVSKNAGQGYLKGVPRNYDAAPTALAHIGVTVPSNIDGQVRGTEVSPQAPTSIETELVTYLTFEDYEDHSGRHNHASVGAGSPTLKNGGRFSKYLEINGSREFLSLGKPSDLDFGAATDFTLMTWYKISGDQSGDPVIVGNKDWRSGANRGTLLLANEGNGDDFGINVASASSDRKDIDPIDYTFNGWWLLVATFDRDGAATLYAGSPSGELNIVAGSIKDVGDLNSSLAWNIGQDGTGHYAYNLKADLDDFAIWRRALTLDEIRKLYNQGEGLELNAILTGEFPTYLNNTFEFVSGQSYPVLITAKVDGSTCGLQWDASLWFNERNAKWDCQNLPDPMFLKVEAVKKVGSSIEVSGRLAAQDNKGSLEWDSRKSGGERNAKFDQNTAGDPLVLTFSTDPNQTLVTAPVGSETCGLEWDADLVGHERNAKWDCAPRMDPLRFELIK